LATEDAGPKGDYYGVTSSNAPQKAHLQQQILLAVDHQDFGKAAELQKKLATITALMAKEVCLNT